jgi:hypothetical protein
MDTDENSIVDYLKAQGVPSDMASRKVIAEKHGIVPYTGTADENIRLLALLRNPPLSFWEEIKAMFKEMLGG